MPSVPGVSTPRHEPSPEARTGRDRQDAIVRQRLRAVSRSGRPALAWHPATGTLAQVDAQAVHGVDRDDGGVPWTDADPTPRDGGRGDAEPPDGTDGVAPPDREVGWLPVRPGAGAGVPRHGEVPLRGATGTPAVPAVPTDGGAAAAQDAVGSMRRRAAETAASAYAAAHGHPTAHSGFAGLADEGRPRWSVRPRTAVVALVVVLALAAGVVAVRLPSGEVEPVAQVGEVDASAAATGQEADAHGATSSTSAASESPAAEDVAVATSAPEGVVVHVVGQVAAPGLVTVPPDARVADALRAAGGATPDADLAALNLARAVTDGEQIVVPRPGEVVALPDPGGAGGGADAAVGPLDLNAADAAALDALPGIGPVLAERIVAWRDENGRFTSVEELGEVSGIGPAVLADVRDLVRV